MEMQTRQTFTTFKSASRCSTDACTSNSKYGPGTPATKILQNEAVDGL